MAALTLFGATDALARRVEVPLAPTNLRVGSLEQQLHILIHADHPADRVDDPVLQLVWVPDSDLDLNASTLTILLDGKVMQRLRLAEHPARSLSLALPKLAYGPHRITLQGALKSTQMRCSAQAASGLTVQDSSNLSWSRRDGSYPPLPLAMYPQTWPRKALVPSDVALSVYPFTAAQVGLAGAFLDADHLLRDWGLRPVHTETPNLVGKFHLATFNEAIPAPQGTDAQVLTAAEQRWRQAHHLLRQQSSLVYAAYADTDRQVVVIGRDFEGLRQGVQMLAVDERRALCVDLVCTGIAQKPTADDRKSRDERSSARLVPTDEVPRPKSDLAPEFVFNLAHKGHARGWSAKHFGTHRLEFTWARPGNWRITADPTLHLKGRVSDAGHVDLKRSTLSVRVNGKPIGTYSLERWAGQKVPLRIPRDLWTDDEWSFLIEAELLPADAGPCQVEHQGAAWVSLDGDSALWVPREETLYDGIAGHVQLFAQYGVPPLEVPREAHVERHLRVAASSLYAMQRAALWPSLQSLADAKTFGALHDLPKLPTWRMAKGPSDCEGTGGCVRVGSLPPPTPLQWANGHWQSDTLVPPMPRVRAQGNPVVLLQPGTTGEVERLVVATGIMPNTSRTSDADNSTADLLPSPWGADSPDLTGLHGRLAVFADKWHLLDFHPTGKTRQVGPKTQAPAEKATMSNEQSKLRWLNFVWAALTLLLVGGLALWFWRKPKHLTVDENWEAHPTGEKPH